MIHILDLPSNGHFSVPLRGLIFYFTWNHIYIVLTHISSCLHRASRVSKTLFIVPTDAHYYKIIELLKQFKIITLALTCFSWRRNHHQGAVLRLAETTKWFLCARRYIRSQCYGSISTCCAGVRFRVETGTACLHNRLICCHNIDCVYTDEHRKTIL